MNAAHLHLLINHFPIIGNIFSILFLVWSFVVKKKEVTQLALCFTIFIALTGYAADFTGDNAEDQVKNLPGITKESIHKHEESADLSLNFLYAAGAAALVALILLTKKHRMANPAIYLTLILALTTSFFLYRTGYEGGLIRHPEIATQANE